MSRIESVKRGQNWRMLLIVSVLTVCFFAVSNLPWNLDDYDQAKQAFVSFQMIGQQRWLYQTTPDEGTKASGGRHSPHHINSKPPAVAWVSAALYQLTRSWDFAGGFLLSLPRSSSQFWFFAVREPLVICPHCARWRHLV